MLGSKMCNGRTQALLDFWHFSSFYFYLAPFPEITDADQEDLESQIADHGADTGPFRKQYNLFLGV